MNEGGFWTQVRAALHEPPRALCRKLTDTYTAGTPDAYYVIDGVVGFLELKYVPRWPVRSDVVRVGLTVEQRRSIEQLRRAGARAHVLLGVDKDWYLLEVWAIPEATGALTRQELEFSRGVIARGTRRLNGLKALRAALTATLEPAS